MNNVSLHQKVSDMVKKVIHLEIKETSEHSHLYFGSMQALFNHLPKRYLDLCPTYGTLRNYGLSELKPYENNHVIIRRGNLITSGVILKKNDKKIIE